jgi:hypothetical protein
MKSYNVIYKHSRGCLHSVILGCPFDDLSSEDQEDFVRNIFTKVNPKCKIIAIFLLEGCDL